MFDEVLDYHGVRLRMCEINMIISSIKNEYKEGYISECTRPYFDQAIQPLQRNVNTILTQVTKENFNWAEISSHVKAISCNIAEINDYVQSFKGPKAGGQDISSPDDWRSIKLDI